VQTRRLGRTGHDSSVAILGGAAFITDTPDEAEGLFLEALEAGVNHLDIAPGYGLAERAVGPHLPAIRHRLFLACKTAETERDWALRRLDRSLERLQVDHLDLYQAHGVTSLEVLDQRDEAFQVILDARDRGLTRYVGVTGHDLGAPSAHLEAVRRYDLDTVMFPVYPTVWSDPTYRADVETLLAECAVRDVGVMAIKAVAWRPWGNRTPDALSWYEPHRTAVDIERGVRFALSTPGVHAFCTPSDPGTARRAISAATRYEPLSDTERQRAVEDAESGGIFPLSEKAVSPWR
jgi:aryl-alcohol dehydrogenase-like predicted oxidoreductase|tara:strand:- start:139 stop:1014 length:876 start_codon:yes stop_codon:yes gene_type:complete